MRRRIDLVRAVATLALAWASVSCRAEPPDDFTLIRLAGRLGPTEVVRVGDQTRPAVALRPDEPRACTVVARRGSLLRFALVAAGAPDTGRVELQVLANRKPTFVRRFKLRREPRLWSLQVRLDQDGPLELGFQVRLERAQASGPLTTQRRPARISLASPRLYVPGRSGARKVLVWISQDSLRADHLGAYGYARPTSPVFDRLAGQGVLFDKALAAASWTLPSLASQFTSRHPSFHGVAGLGRLRDAAHSTLFSTLASAGFTVLGVTGNRFVSHEFGTAAGFDALWYSKARADELNRIALEALSEWQGGDLALFLHYQDPHFPYEPPSSHDRFDPGYRGSADGRNFERFRTEQREDVAHVQALYDGEVSFNDEQIGALLAALRERGLLDGALVVYSSDHGEEFLDHGGWTHSRTVYEELLHVPLLLRLPDGRARRVHEPVSLVDLAPTILDAFGIPSPSTFQGRSLLRLASGGEIEQRAIFAETSQGLDKRHRLAVRRGTLKTILTMPRAPEPARVLSEEQFDLASDPREQNSLPPSPAHARLRAEALAFMTRARVGGSGADALQLSAETIEELRALGYLN